MTARTRTAAEWRAEARRLEREATAADDRGDGLAADRLRHRSRLAWRAAGHAGLVAIGGGL